MDPFTGVETYSMRYQPKKNILPKLSDRPFSKIFLSLNLVYSLLIFCRQRAIPRRALVYTRRRRRGGSPQTYQSNYEEKGTHARSVSRI